MKILDHKDAIYRRQDIVETAIHRVSCLNRTVLGVIPHTKCLEQLAISDSKKQKKLRKLLTTI